jgi:hypothetical protein
MAAVPIIGATLRDVKNNMEAADVLLNITSLNVAIQNAIATSYDATYYTAPTTSLKEFRNYDHIPAVLYKYLIVAPNKLTSNVWSNITFDIGFQDYSGALQTNRIISQSGHTTSSALLANNLSSGGFTDWYLPTALEYPLSGDIAIINSGLTGIGGDLFINENLWTSRQATNTVNADAGNYIAGTFTSQPKSNSYNSRAIRTAFNVQGNYNVGDSAYGGIVIKIL